MAKKILGIEIGSSQLKMALCIGSNLERIYTAEVPDNLVIEDEIVSWEAMADFIKEVIKQNRISCKDVAVVMPEKLAYVQSLTMPAMTDDQLKVNLPYEFHDYINDDKDKYFYDYSVIEMRNDEAGEPKEMDLMGVAAPKEIINQYRTMFRRAGLKLVLIAPEYCAFKNIIKDYEEVHKIEEKRDYVILDIGHSAARMHFFTKGEYEVTRIMEPGVGALDRQIAESTGADVHIAKLYKESNKDEVLYSQECRDIYNRLAIEVMRVLNFYNFNHPDNTVNKIYYCGGGALIEPLLEDIKNTIDMDLEGMDALFTDKYDDRAGLLIGLPALGITWE